MSYLLLFVKTLFSKCALSMSVVTLRANFANKYVQGRCLLIQRYFYAVYHFAGIADLSKGYRNSKRKLGDNHAHAIFRDN